MPTVMSWPSFGSATSSSHRGKPQNCPLLRANAVDNLSFLLIFIPIRTILPAELERKTPCAQFRLRQKRRSNSPQKLLTREARLPSLAFGDGWACLAEALAKTDPFRKPKQKASNHAPKNAISNPRYAVLKTARHLLPARGLHRWRPLYLILLSRISGISWSILRLPPPKCRQPTQKHSTDGKSNT